jgi:DNA-binding NtrC family response regulator
VTTILVIDDEEKLRQLLKRILLLEGFDLKGAGTLQEGRKMLEKEHIDVILCDVRLPDGNGVDFVKEIKEKYPALEIILLTAYGNISDGVQAMRNGAFDYLRKGDDNDKIIPLLNKVVDKLKMSRKLDQLQKEAAIPWSFERIIGHAEVLLEAVSQARKVASSDTTLLLLGETGTGKEVFARAVHYNSKRSGQPFVAVNCSAFSRELLESELFGHKAGAFTGAVKDKKGLFEEADGGTIFLDEIGEMQAGLQAKLLRVLESGEFIKVGDTKLIKVNVRIIAATNRNLLQEMEAGHFRADLFYRLSVFQLTLPALRERKQDIPALARHFAALFAARSNKPVPLLDKEFLDALQHYHWPGNIRELKNAIERSVILENTGVLKRADLPFKSSDSAENNSGFDLAVVEKQHILKVLKHTGGNKTEAARLLGIGLTTLYRKIEEYQLH